MDTDATDTPEALPSLSSLCHNNPHFFPCTAAGPSRHRLSSAVNGLTEDLGTSWLTGRAESSTSSHPQLSAPSFSTTGYTGSGHPGSAFLQYSPLPTQHIDSSPSSNDIQITGSKLTRPPAGVSAYPSLSFPQHAGKGMNSSMSSALNPPHSPFLLPDISPGQGWTSTRPPSGHAMPPPRPIGTNGFNATGNSNGISASSAIDLSSARLPSPPPVNDKKPVCIGSLTSRAIMLYPCPAAVVGAQAPDGSNDKYQTVNYRGAELLKVRIKVSRYDWTFIVLMLVS